MSHSLRRALQRLERGELSARQCVAQWRAETLPALAALPPRFGEVLEALLMRLESAADFAGESCSFSQQALIDELGRWLDKAEPRLGADSPP